MQLIFVYNADSGRLNALFDIAHKIVRPETYECSLCLLTHGTLSEKKAWTRFRQSKDTDFVFLHKDEFERQYGLVYEYPVILKQADILEVALDADEIRKLRTVEELTAEIRKLTA